MTSLAPSMASYSWSVGGREEGKEGIEGDGEGGREGGREREREREREGGRRSMLVNVHAYMNSLVTSKF